MARGGVFGGESSGARGLVMVLPVIFVGLVSVLKVGSNEMDAMVYGVAFPADGCLSVEGTDNSVLCRPLDAPGVLGVLVSLLRTRFYQVL